MHDVDKYGIGKVVEMALAHVNPRGERPVHLSFDVDATDPSVAASESSEARRVESGLRVSGPGLGRLYPRPSVPYRYRTTLTPSP
jgi:arginase